MTIRSSATLLGAMALVATACGSNGGIAVPDEPVPTTSAPIPDHTEDPVGDWVAVEGVVDGTPVGLVDGREVTMSLDGGELSGSAACNGYFGLVTIDAPAFDVGGLSWTEMGCEPAVMELEQTYLTSLSAVEHFELVDDVLTLSGPEVGWIFERPPPLDDAALVGSRWAIDTLVSG